MKLNNFLVTLPLLCFGLAFIQKASLDEIIQPGDKAEKLADGFLFTEGPAADAKGNVCFGGEDMKSLYRIRTKIKGAY